MAHVVSENQHADCLHLPLAAVRFPVELILPDGFDPADTATWPRGDGRLEFVGGRLLYMPPCGTVQQVVCIDLVSLLRQWSRSHPDFMIGSNEAGMKLGDDVRAADAAVWRRGDPGPASWGLPRVPPVLAVEVEGRDEDEVRLRAKARWYLDSGVVIVWLVLPSSREVVVLTTERESRHGPGAKLPDSEALPGLAPAVDELFEQLAAVG